MSSESSYVLYMKTTIITTVTDLRSWIWDTNPGNCVQGDSYVDAIQEAIRSDATRPAWGADWGTWLDTNAERIAIKATS